MKISTLKFGNTDPDLRKSSFILYLIYIISNPVGISIGVLSPNQFPLFIQIFDIITILAAFLSLAELKLAAFIKLGLTSKEIASLTYNTKESIDVARSRLRKKLKFPSSLPYLFQFNTFAFHAKHHYENTTG